MTTLTLRGKYNTAQVFTELIEQEAVSQIIELLNQESIQGEQFRLMPDCHAGAGCVIGTTITLNQHKIIPNLVGDLSSGQMQPSPSLSKGRKSVHFHREQKALE